MSASLSPIPEPYVLNGITYISGKLDAFQQFHVMRKLGPLIAKIGPAFLTPEPPAVVTNADGTRTTVPVNPFSDIQKLAPALEALSLMSEEDCDYVLHRCLAVTKRFQDPGIWAQIWSDQAKQLMFSDIDFATVMQIAIHVLGDNLAGFSLGGQPSTAVPPSAPNGPLNTSPLPTVRIS